MNTSKKLLLIVDAPVFPGVLLQEVSDRCHVSLADITVIPELKGLSHVESGAFDAVVSVSSAPHAHSVQLLGQVLAAAKPGATITVQEPVATPTKGAGSSAKLEQLLLLSGLVTPSAAQAYNLPPTPGVAGDSAVSPAAAEACKPTWQPGAQQSIKRRPAVKQSPVVLAATDEAWAAIDPDDGELLDDEELLTEEDLVRPAAPAADDCGVSKKACKNCSCGRAEAEAAGEPAPVLTKQMLDNPGSAGGCGSCALGDAFRCGTCPYRGLPSFEMGKKIELPAGFLAADI